LFVGLDTSPLPGLQLAKGTFNFAFLDSPLRAIKIRAKKAEGDAYMLEASLAEANVPKGYLAVREEDDPVFGRYRNFLFVEDPKSLSRMTAKKIWYQDFKVASEPTQPLKIGIPGQWGTRSNGFALADS
jgi:hypothetical protein